MAATPDESHQTLLSKRDGSSSNLTIAKDPRASAKVEKKVVDMHTFMVQFRLVHHSDEGTELGIVRTHRVA
eukprot:g50963.t1